MRRARLRALPALTLLLAGCGPLATATLEVPEIRLTLPAQRFPAYPGGGVGDCGPGCLSADLRYDLGAEVDALSDPSADAELWLEQVDLALAAGSGTDLRGLASVVLSVYPPAGGAPVTVASYQRPAGAAPTAVEVKGAPGVDLARYLDGGVLRVRAELTYDAPTPTFEADVAARFRLELELDASQLL
ncbi:hypothetical protein ACOQFB_11030 [Anaeromyxobacter sp. Red801]|uniref:hypothetical protein n=1 Tax=Anaeromyxobacter sp. Red801 TaxID=3411632 RepID=UPI003B9E31E7